MDQEVVVNRHVILSPNDYGRITQDYQRQGYEVRDLLPAQAAELSEIVLIGQPDVALEVETKKYLLNNYGTLVAYPWRKIVLRVLNRLDFIRLLTSRNKNLITLLEQEKFMKAKLAVAGLSVGSNIVASTIMQGGCQAISVADGDFLATSNLNRVMGNLFQLDLPKAVVTAQKGLEVNPYLDLTVYASGLNSENLAEFLFSADIVFDEIDSLWLKLELRLQAKSMRKPVVMITDNGDNIMVDIERYDLNPNLLPFHGLLSEEDMEAIGNSHGQLTPQQRVQYSLKIVGPENAVQRMQESLLEVGKTLKTWPQLGTASTLAGAVGCYIARRIACGQPLAEGRLHISIDAALIPEYMDSSKQAAREAATAQFIRVLSGSPTE